MGVLNRIAQKVFDITGFRLVRQKYYLQIQRLSGVGFNKLLWILMNSPNRKFFDQSLIGKVITNSRSQLGQDIFALVQVGPNRIGFFVEFGATNGLDLSNSFLLESEFGWTGILCEPAKIWHASLRRNRKAIIDTRCVYSGSGIALSFSEVSQGAELSTISSFANQDLHATARQKSLTYEVESVSLLDLLIDHNAPKHIDFLSVDTEGSEFEILNAFDFSKYTFGAISVEHNYTDSRHKVRDLLLSKGYRQVYPELSDFDDWFVPDSGPENSLSN